MASENTIQVLNHIVNILNYSLPIYLSDATPYVPEQESEAAKTIESIAEQMREMAGRISREIVEENGKLKHGEFPITYTSLHDLSFDYLLGQMIRQQERDIADIEAGVSELGLAPRAKALAEEVLGAEKGHLDSMRELQDSKTKT